MATSKATKKFEKRHLKDALKRRKDVSKIKQKQQLKAKKKSRDAEDRGDDIDGEQTASRKDNSKAGDNQFENMTVDEFFQNGFEIPERTKGKRKRTTPSADRATKKQKQQSPENNEEDENEDDGEEEISSDSNAVADTAEISDSDSSGSELDEETHRKQLEALAKKDPEFYKHLKENEPELLDFEEGDFAELDQLSEEDQPSKKKRKASKKTLESDSDDESTDDVTLGMVQKWETAMVEQKSLRSTREVVLAFRAAAHLNEDKGKAYKFTITNSDVYNKLLVTALKHIPDVLQHHLPAKELASGKINLATDSKKYRTMTPMIKSHIASVMHLIINLSDEGTIRLTLSSILALLPHILSFRKVVKELTKIVVGIWSDSSSTEATRIAAFLILRRLVLISDAGIKEAVLKTTYQGLVKGSRNTTAHTIQGVNLMKNSAAELWGMDATIGYTTGFTFIRQLAIHLRSTITNNSKDSYKVIYNWQCVHSLDFWSRVLAHHCSSLREAESGKESPLRPLIYPTVQVTLGAMRLIPTAQYFPLRFQLIRSLLRISMATNTYIPLASALFEVLNSAEMRKPPKPTTLKALDFSISIRAGKALLRTRVYQDGVGEQVTELFSEFFVLWSKSVSFPELALPVIVMLKRWLKEVSNKKTGNKNGKLSYALGLLVQKLESNSRWIVERRAKVDFAPNNRAGVENFLKEESWEKTPIGAFVVGQRKAREEKAKLLEEGRKEHDRKRKNRGEDKKYERDGAFDEDDDEQDVEDEDEEEEEEEGSEAESEAESEADDSE